MAAIQVNIFKNMVVIPYEMDSYVCILDHKICKGVE